MAHEEHHTSQHLPGNLWARLFVRRAEDQAALVARLDRIEQTLQRLAEQREPAPTAERAPTLQETLTALERQINKAGREQFKANALAETQATQLASALETLQAATTRRETELGALRDQGREAVAAARLDVVRAILPALDGLDEAIRSGETLLQTAMPPARATPHARAETGWFRRWFTQQHAIPQPAAQTNEWHDSLRSWLQGLTFVRERLLNQLANEGVRPIGAVGQTFDPALHIALQVQPANVRFPAGTVAAELRRGYTVGGRVLRHAEVAVAGEPEVGS